MISFVETCSIIQKGGNSFLLNLTTSVFCMEVRHDVRNELCSLCLLYYLIYQLQFLFHLCP